MTAGSPAGEGATWIVVPVRSLTDGKRRLAPVLGPRERAALVCSMFVHTLEAAAAAGPPVLVVSPDPEALALARGHGAAGLAEPRPIGLNHALSLAAREVRGRGAEALLVVAADLPHLEGSDLRAMLPSPASDGAGRAGSPAPADPIPTPAAQRDGPRTVSGTFAGEPTVRIAPDESGTGTNALYVRPPALLAFTYGEGSFARHVEQAGALGVRAERVERWGLRFDLDTPDDLERCERGNLGGPHGKRER